MLISLLLVVLKISCSLVTENMFGLSQHLMLYYIIYSSELCILYTNIPVYKYVEISILILFVLHTV